MNAIDSNGRHASPAPAAQTHHWLEAGAPAAARARQRSDAQALRSPEQGFVSTENAAPDRRLASNTEAIIFWFCVVVGVAGLLYVATRTLMEHHVI